MMALSAFSPLDLKFLYAAYFYILLRSWLSNYLRQFLSVYAPNIYSPTLINVTVGPKLLQCEWNVLELHP